MNATDDRAGRCPRRISENQKENKGKSNNRKKEENVRADNGRRMEGNVRAGGYITGQ